MEADEEGYYIRGDYVGKLGVEKSYEKYLRGEKGIEILLRDAHGRIQGHYMDGEYDRPSVPGKNLTLSLDIDLQMLGERLLKNKIGSIVAIEPETGEILLSGIFAELRPAFDDWPSAWKEPSDVAA